MRHRRIGAHFRLAEFRAASSARLTRRDVEAIELLVAVYLDPMRERFGPCRIHSAKRSRRRNAEVGGAPRSWHLYGLRPGEAAVDCSFERGSPADWAHMAATLGPTFTVTYPSHVHVDTRQLAR